MLKQQQSILFIGDSITDAGRGRPVGRPGGLGTGYVNIIHGLIATLHPELCIYILNTGCNGDTVRNLKSRWKSDVLDLKADWLSVMIGINDVWRQFGQSQYGDAVLLKEYESTLRGLLKRTRPGLKGLILMTPFFIEPNEKEPMRAMMDSYGATAKKLANEFDAVFVDTQAAYNRVMRYVHPMKLARDRVHPEVVGHTIIAIAWMKSMGLLNKDTC